MQVIGIDVAKATFDIALPLGQDKYRTRGKVGNDPAGWEQLLAWRQKHAADAAVGMEATGISTKPWPNGWWRRASRSTWSTRPRSRPTGKANCCAPRPIAPMPS